MRSTAEEFRPNHAVRRGFTMVELLVSIGIIVLLAGILVPVVVGVVKRGQKSRTQADLQAISVALDAYKADFYDYPRPTAARTGAATLCRALIAPDGAAADGADGPGFRIRQGVGGRVYGPYLNADKFPVTGTGPTAAMTDREGAPILYYPAFFPKANIRVTAGGGYVGDNDYSIAQLANANLKPLYNATDGPATLVTANVRAMLGDKNFDGKIDTGETPLGTGSYILWSAGGDLFFGPVSTAVADVKKADDILVFGP